MILAQLDGPLLPVGRVCHLVNGPNVEVVGQELPLGLVGDLDPNGSAISKLLHSLWNKKKKRSFIRKQTFIFSKLLYNPFLERLESVRIGKSQNAFFFKIGKCQNRKVSELESVRIGKCQNGKVSELESVRIGKCQNWKVSELESVRIGKCQNR